MVFPFLGMAQINVHNDSIKDSETTKNIRIEKRKQARKNLTDRFRIGLYTTNSSINSSIRFELPSSLVSFQIDLEDHLGLDDKKMIYFGTIVYRITPKSGINALYYSLNRKSTIVLNRDIIFLGDTIHKDEVLETYMNTSIYSIGYIFSILTDQKSFLGAFINLYIATARIGISSKLFEYQNSAQYFAATPNIGFIASFKLTRWMSLSGGLGLFFLNTPDWGGTFHDAQIVLDVFPVKYVGLSIGYQVFDLKGEFVEQNYNAYLNYNINGPTFGLKFIF